MPGLRGPHLRIGWCVTERLRKAPSFSYGDIRELSGTEYVLKKAVDLVNLEEVELKEDIPVPNETDFGTEEETSLPSRSQEMGLELGPGTEEEVFRTVREGASDQSSGTGTPGVEEETGDGVVAGGRFPGPPTIPPGPYRILRSLPLIRYRSWEWIWD